MSHPRIPLQPTSQEIWEQKYQLKALCNANPRLLTDKGAPSRKRLIKELL